MPHTSLASLACLVALGLVAILPNASSAQAALDAGLDGAAQAARADRDVRAGEDGGLDGAAADEVPADSPPRVLFLPTIEASDGALTSDEGAAGVEATIVVGLDGTASCKVDYLEFPITIPMLAVRGTY